MNRLDVSTGRMACFTLTPLGVEEHERFYFTTGQVNRVAAESGLELVFLESNAITNCYLCRRKKL